MMQFGRWERGMRRRASQRRSPMRVAMVCGILEMLCNKNPTIGGDGGVEFTLA
jgi:hypothetical protein